jgi:DNA-directed RNA polymerase subunit RPC12/RpoP
MGENEQPHLQMVPRCPRCGAEMLNDDDIINKVRVFVCSDPTCLYRVYPDYPRRNANEEVCYFCGKIFKAWEPDPGVLCPDCKGTVNKNRRDPVEKPKETELPKEPDMELHLYRFGRKRSPKRQIFIGSIT